MPHKIVTYQLHLRRADQEYQSCNLENNLIFTGVVFDAKLNYIKKIILKS